MVTNQWVNSYKRLVPGFEAPVYLSWARRNRSDLIRVPEYKRGKESATRLEYRAADPACNPYLVFSAMLAAGLRGIEKGYTCPEPLEENVFEMDEEARRERDIDQLPGSLQQAIDLAEQSELLPTAQSQCDWQVRISGCQNIQTLFAGPRGRWQGGGSGSTEW